MEKLISRSLAYLSTVRKKEKLKKRKKRDKYKKSKRRRRRKPDKEYFRQNIAGRSKILTVASRPRNHREKRKNRRGPQDRKGKKNKKKKEKEKEKRCIILACRRGPEVAEESRSRRATRPEVPSAQAHTMCAAYKSATQEISSFPASHAIQSKLTMFAWLGLLPRREARISQENFLFPSEEGTRSPPWNSQRDLPPSLSLSLSRLTWHRDRYDARTFEGKKKKKKKKKKERKKGQAGEKYSDTPVSALMKMTRVCAMEKGGFGKTSQI